MTTVNELFQHAGVHYGGAVPWGDDVPLTGPGVYVISTNANPNDSAGLTSCPVNHVAIASLLLVRPEMTINGDEADAQSVASRLEAMWPAGESVVYVGLAGTSTRKRVSQFYRTQIGARAPHAGGWPIKLLDTTRLWVHYGPIDAPAVAEISMVDRFADGLTGDVRCALIDPMAPLPFANLTFPGGRRKRHGFRGAKVLRNGAVSQLSDQIDQIDRSSKSLVSAEWEDAVDAATSRWTQNLTETDIAAGRIRIPKVSKALFPDSKSEIRVELGGETHNASWAPRAAEETERSGVIGIGRGVLTRHISAGKPRTVERTATGYRIS